MFLAFASLGCDLKVILVSRVLKRFTEDIIHAIISLHIGCIRSFGYAGTVAHLLLRKMRHPRSSLIRRSESMQLEQRLPLFECHSFPWLNPFTWVGEERTCLLRHIPIARKINPNRMMRSVYPVAVPVCSALALESCFCLSSESVYMYSDRL